ncbi:hypothetical protein T01_15316 [Trichinella spiralis]|uniref:Uncharacterized protein n=1 Tax=Trichinella spiralis TaxID=6334 RepID=A0A0V0YWR8_TRISP|nr:hypothetical protein T01_15316 [Trichinella spiralis]
MPVRSPFPASRLQDISTTQESRVHNTGGLRR